ncbi:hypothetical protein [Kitasatospora sp. A2-31]|uniref:hypothetical protein n=1 Tax=Kitasatospora sp. A2-31 TaxID=2916414 RepID=UPI001EE88D32|nr:hypothetical protein [Kitasatospora sp. A2-31]MCG6493455.1 hypothetical protein [Kitasatospora sp. A2-31]
MTAITATNAATQAGVTVATIRTWCRTGAVAAVKKAGRWAIDAASLAYRIKLPTLLRKRRPVVFTPEAMVAIGGKRWQRNGMDRVYFDNWAELAGLDVSYYKSGNISDATYRDEAISNSQARLILGSLSKVWFDTADGKLHCRLGWTDSRIATRDEIFKHAVAGIRTAITSL